MHGRLARMLSRVAERAGRRGVSRMEGRERVFPVPSGAEGAWIARARPVSRFRCEAMFAIERSVHVGPENGGDAVDWETANVRLPRVELARRFADGVTTAELLDREDAMVAHYRRIVGIVERSGRTGALRPFPLFRVQPAVIVDDEPAFAFCWVDDVPGSRTVLEALAEAANGPPRLVHADQDQNWGLEVVATEAATCLTEWDAEGPPPAEGGLAFDRAELARQASAALRRLEIVHGRLVAAIGRDYWT